MSTTARLALAVLVLIGFGCFCGAGLAWVVGPRQNVIRVIQTRVETKEVKPKGCLDGASGIVTAAYSEHVNLGEKDDPAAWTYGNIVTLDVGGINHTCYFEGSRDLTHVLKLGMRWQPSGGDPI